MRIGGKFGDSSFRRTLIIRASQVLNGTSLDVPILLSFCWCVSSISWPLPLQVNQWRSWSKSSVHPKSKDQHSQNGCCAGQSPSSCILNGLFLLALVQLGGRIAEGHLPLHQEHLPKASRLEGKMKLFRALFKVFFRHMGSRLLTE